MQSMWETESVVLLVEKMENMKVQNDSINGDLVENESYSSEGHRKHLTERLRKGYGNG